MMNKKRLRGLINSRAKIIIEAEKKEKAKPKGEDKAAALSLIDIVKTANYVKDGIVSLPVEEAEKFNIDQESLESKLEKIKNNKKTSNEDIKACLELIFITS